MLFKLSSVLGLGKTINALAMLPGRADLQTADPENSADPDALAARANALFDKVYTSQAEKLKASLASSHPRLLPLVLHFYGNVLSLDQDPLCFQETEIAIVACAVCEGGILLDRQGFSHKRALEKNGFGHLIAPVVELSGLIKQCILSLPAAASSL